MAKKGGDSKGLVVTLVLFILFSLALGVTAYFGFAEQDKLRGEKSKATKELADRTKERDWYRLQSWMYRAYMGHLGSVKPDDILALKGQFDSLGAGQTDKDEVANLTRELAKKGLAWAPNKNLPDSNYETLVLAERRNVEDVRKRNAQLDKELAAAKKSVEELESALAEAKKTFDAQLVELNKKAQADMAGLVQKLTDLQASYDKLSGEKAQLAKKNEDDKTKGAQAVQKLEKALKEAVDVVKAREVELQQAKAKGQTDAPKDWHSDWRIEQIDRYGQTVWINLGSADRVVPQLTFSVHGKDLSGKPIPESKGSVEVMNVMGERLSRARVTSVKDPNRDPILPGDILYNPTWSPTLRKHVAVVGIVDLNGDGRDDLPEFMRNLERQNVIVDAYLDLRDFSIKGPGMSVRTEYLILGAGPEAFSDHSERENREFVDKLAKAMGDMQNQAARYGVTPIGLRKYLELIGYRLPRAAADKATTSSVYRPRVTAPSRDNGGDAPRRDDRPMDDK